MLKRVNITKKRIGNLLLLLVGVFYVVYNLYGGKHYFSPDELLFSDDSIVMERDGLDYKYVVWVTLITFLQSINVILPQIIFSLCLVVLMWGLGRMKVFEHRYLILMMLFPTVFYFTNSILRDVIFFLVSLYVLLFVKALWQHGVVWWLLLFVLLMFSVVLRPIYGMVMILSILLSYYFFSHINIINKILIFIFLLIGVCISVSASLKDIYYNFFFDGHGRHVNELGTMMIPINSFDNTSAALNFVLSPFYFWCIPATGLGDRLDYFIWIENVVLMYMIIVAILSMKKRKKFYDFSYRMSSIMIIVSLFFASFTTTHGDSYRFRLMYIPYILYAYRYGL